MIFIFFIKIKRYKIILNKIFPFFFEKQPKFIFINRNIHLRHKTQTKKFKLILDWKRRLKIFSLEFHSSKS